MAGGEADLLVVWIFVGVLCRVFFVLVYGVAFMGGRVVEYLDSSPLAGRRVGDELVNSRYYIAYMLNQTMPHNLSDVEAKIPFRYRPLFRGFQCPTPP